MHLILVLGGEAREDSAVHWGHERLEHKAVILHKNRGRKRRSHSSARLECCRGRRPRS